MDINSWLNDLTCKVGISGYENSVAEFALNKLKNYCDKCEISKMGSVHGFIKGKGEKNRKKIMLEAHMDQVGFLVSKINDDGTISCVPVGGIDARILPGLNVKIIGSSKIIDGVVLAPSDESVTEKNADIKSLKIFTGYEKEELSKYIALGDAVVFDNSYTKLQSTKRCSAAMDNRSGMATVIYALEKFKETPIDSDIYVLFSTEEEIGLRGAYTGAYEIDPDMAIVVDVTHGVTVDSKEESGVFNLGCGAVVLRGPNVDYAMTKELIALSEKLGIKHEIEVAGGASGTTAWAIQTIKSGVPTLLISIPLRYMHTNVEVLDINDIKECGELMAAAARFFGKEDK